MKLIFSTILTLTVLAQSISGSLLVFKFQAQKKYITEKLCENRSKPSKGCEGKCYLKKMLKQSEEAEKALPGSIKEKMEVAYVLQVPALFSFDYSLPISSPEYAYHYFIPLSPTFSALQPPRA